MMTSGSASCVVCEKSVSESFLGTCNTCGGTFHFRQREDLEGDDCGEAWISEEHVALIFACATCLGAPSEQTLQDVLTAAEAAARMGITEKALIGLADSGAIRHRRAGEAIYLFAADDIDAFK